MYSACTPHAWGCFYTPAVSCDDVPMLLACPDEGAEVRAALHARRCRRRVLLVLLRCAYSVPTVATLVLAPTPRVRFDSRLAIESAAWREAACGFWCRAQGEFLLLQLSNVVQRGLLWFCIVCSPHAHVTTCNMATTPRYRALLSKSTARQVHSIGNGCSSQHSGLVSWQ